jgi:hypothetical protein
MRQRDGVLGGILQTPRRAISIPAAVWESGGPDGCLTGRDYRSHVLLKELTQRRRVTLLWPGGEGELAGLVTAAEG